jgi:hypothetical protein
MELNHLRAALQAAALPLNPPEELFEMAEA